MAEHHQSVELAPGIWLLQHRGHNSFLLELEALKFEDGGSRLAGAAPRWIWIDPGDAEVFPEIVDRAEELMGGFGSLAAVVATGLGEGAVRSLPALLERAPLAFALMNSDTWNFVSVGGIPEKRIRLVERFRPGLHLADVGRTLQVVVNPYGQFTGAFLLYEPHTGFLFSGDLLATATHEAPAEIRWASEEDWPQIRAYQERVMPCNSALRWTLAQVRRLDGLEALCPQSGPLLRGEVLDLFLRRLEELPVGADLLTPDSAALTGPELVLEVP